jgi:hypothetical protein
MRNLRTHIENADLDQTAANVYSLKSDSTFRAKTLSVPIFISDERPLYSKRRILLYSIGGE